MSTALTSSCLLLGLTLLGGCDDIWVHDSYDVMLRQSAVQTMQVVNNSNRSLTYQSGAAAGTLPAGGHLTLTFQVNTIGTLMKPNGTPYWTVLPDRYRESFIETDSYGLAEDASDPLKITFHDGATPVFASFSLNLCPGGGWATAPTFTKAYTIAVPDPLPAIPQVVCPP
jgi:hypothetical protein